MEIKDKNSNNNRNCRSKINTMLLICLIWEDKGCNTINRCSRGRGCSSKYRSISSNIIIMYSKIKACINKTKCNKCNSNSLILDIKGKDLELIYIYLCLFYY